jgi:hypothetical protein
MIVIYTRQASKYAGFLIQLKEFFTKFPRWDEEFMSEEQPIIEVNTDDNVVTEEHAALRGLLRCIHSGKLINSIFKDKKGYFSRKKEDPEKYIYYKYRCKNNCKDCCISPKLIDVDLLDDKVKSIVIANILNILFPEWLNDNEDGITQEVKNLNYEKFNLINKLDEGELSENISSQISGFDEEITYKLYNRNLLLPVNKEYYSYMKNKLESENRRNLNRLYQNILKIDVDLKSKQALLRIISLNEYGKYKSSVLYKNITKSSSDEDIDDMIKSKEEIEIIRKQVENRCSEENIDDYEVGEEKLFIPNFLFYKINL